ncbi:MAG: 50S ribosomal protein L1, partial [Saprospiraceae bacterium]
MAKLSKKMAIASKKVDSDKLYDLTEAMKLVKEVNLTKFDSSVDLHIRLGVDPRKADQAIRGTVSLPHGTGKTKKVLVLCTPDKVQEALAAGADFAGLEEYIAKIAEGWTGIDVIVAMPSVMAQVGKVGRILGPRGLMPNPKSGTVTMDITGAVQEVKAGKIAFRVDKFGIIHSPVGRVSFTAEKLQENALELLNTI